MSSGTVSRLYCNNERCALVSMNGGFQRGRKYRCPMCGKHTSEQRTAKKGALA